MEEPEQPVRELAAPAEMGPLTGNIQADGAPPESVKSQDLKAPCEEGGTADASVLEQEGVIFEKPDQQHVQLINDLPESDPKENDPSEPDLKDTDPPESDPKENGPRTESNEKPIYRDAGTMTSDFEELRGMIFLPEAKQGSQPTGDAVAPQGEEARVRETGELVNALAQGDAVTQGEAGRTVSMYGEGADQQAVAAQRSIMEVDLGPGEQGQAGGQLSMSSPDPDFGSPDSKRKGGLRCEVCKRVKKAGCGTENAHPRCERRPHDMPAIAQLDMEHLMKLSAIDEDERVSLWNPTTGQRLSGMAAPMLRNLPAWLMNHKGWEPVEKPPEGAPSKKRRRPSAQPALDSLLVATESSDQQSPTANPPQTPNPMGTPEGSGTPVQVKVRPPPEPPTPEELERQREAAAEARRVRKELGPRCEVCQTIKKAGCGTEEANARCLRHPRRGPDGQLIPLPSSQEAAEKRSVEKKPAYKYEGGRCDVCTAIKKGGCGTDSAHRRCLKNPRGVQLAMSPLQAMTNGHDDSGADIVPVMIEQQRVTLWHPEKKQKLCGMAAPMLKNLDNYLRLHPGWIAVRRVDEMLSFNPDENAAQDPTEIRVEDPNQGGVETHGEIGIETPGQVGLEVYSEAAAVDPNEAVAAYTNETGAENAGTGAEVYIEAAVATDPSVDVPGYHIEAVVEEPNAVEGAVPVEIMTSAPEDAMNVDRSGVETAVAAEVLASVPVDVMNVDPNEVEMGVPDKGMGSEMLFAASDGAAGGDIGVAEATQELVTAQ